MIPQFKPFMGDSEYMYIKKCFDSNWFTEGPLSKEFTERLCQMLDVKYGVLAPNGTLALYLGLRALGIGPGDEVIVPDFSFIASATAIEMTGATPVFCDIDETLHLDFEKAKKLVSRRTKAIMPVHIYGMACDMNQLMTFANSFGLKVIEDAAQGIGVTWGNRNVGTFGDIGTFSFFADKTITTGEGGFVVTNDEKIYEDLLYLRNQGRIDRGKFIHPRIGYNFRSTDIQSAIGLAQLEKLDAVILDKARIISTFRTNLNPDIEVLRPMDTSLSNHIPFRVCIRVPGGSENLLLHLSSKGIEPRTFFYPLHLQPCFNQSKGLRLSRRRKQDFAGSIKAYQEGVCLPSWVGLPENDILKICDVINDFLQH
jgi:perosamine synthetase